MQTHEFIQSSVVATGVLPSFIATAELSRAQPIDLHVDATDVAQKILHARLEIPARPGEVKLVYPKWIPGEHGPTGPINNLVDVKMSAGGQALEWRRDDVDMFAFHVTVPAGATNLEVALDFLLTSGNGKYSSGGSVTEQLIDLNWNQLLLYPQGPGASEIQFAASLRLPEGWKFGTALPLARELGNDLEFAPASLERLVDSPLIAGRYFRTIELTPGEQPAHYLDMVADSLAALEIKPEDIQHYKNLVAETGALFGARHYRNYHFLLTLSDHVASFGLEHHESSDDRSGEESLTDEKKMKLFAGLLPHEMVHSWNGKYRRPAGLATADYQQPMKGDLLWVYEGLTTYLGNVLTARCGLWTNADFQQYIALISAGMDQRAGRSWRPLSDTTSAAQLLYEASAEGDARRRSVDFYPEGMMIWLEADTIIREQTHGSRSLNDFCKAFYGGQSGPPTVVPYTIDDVIAALNKVAPFDWKGFFQKRIYDVNARAPLGGIENGGWHLGYTNQPTGMLKATEGARKFTDMSYCLGFSVMSEDGTIKSVIPGSPADRAGMSPGLKLVAVNNRSWTPELLRTATKSAVTNSAPIQLLVKNEDYFKTCSLDYHEGEKYPCLERDASEPDLLGDILKPLAPETSEETAPTNVGGYGLSNQARALRIEFPARNQELHRRGIISRAERHFFITLVGLFDFFHVHFDSKARRCGDGDGSVDNFQRLFRQALAVLPNPVRINSGNFSRRGGGDMREHRERNIEVIVRVRTPGEPAPIAAELRHAHGALHGPEMRIGQRNIHGLQLQRVGQLRPIGSDHVRRRREAGRAAKFRHYLAAGFSILRSAGIFGVSQNFVLIGAKRNRFRERPRAIRIERDAGFRKTFCQCGDSFHFLHAGEDAAFEFEIIKAITRMRRVGEAHDAVHRQRLFVTQSQPVIFRIRCAEIRQVRFLAIANVKQIAERFDGVALLAFTQQCRDGNLEELPQQVEQRAFNRGDRMDGCP